MSELIGVLDERYELIAKIGAGGFSEVWRGRDLVLDRPVAIKLLHGGLGAHEEFLLRFRAEARHAGLVSHQNVARIYDYCDPDPQHPPYLVMELVEGQSLAQHLEREGAIGPGPTLDLLAQAARGLQAAHEAGLIHRDIKPENLLLDESGTVKITDFGISQAAGSVPLTRTGMIIGSPGYLAPERAAGARATAASDLYALGVVAHECLSGAPPFTGTDLDVVQAHLERPLPPLPPSVPPGLAGLVAELTAKSPGDRPASAALVASRAAELSGQPAMPGTVTLVDRPARAGGPQPFDRPRRPSAPGGPAPAQRPAAARRPLVGKRLALGLGAGAVALLAGVLGLSLLGTASQQARGKTKAAGVNGQSIQAVKVFVDRSDLVGEPVAVARAQLERRHLVVLVRWRVTSAAPAGRVLAADPAGELSPDTLVTLTAAQAPAPPAKPRKGKDRRTWLRWPPGHDHGPGGPPGHHHDPPGHHHDPPGHDGNDRGRPGPPKAPGKTPSQLGKGKPKVP